MKKPTKIEIENAYAELEKAKAAYKAWDQMLARLLNSRVTSVKTKIGNFEVIDLFATKDIVWKPVAQKRFELKKVS